MISDILKNNGLYSPTDEQLFERTVKVRMVSKDEILIHPGEICKSVYFNITGAFYQYTYKDEIEENIIDLHSDNEWFFNHLSFISQKPSDSFTKAFTEGQVLELTIESLHSLMGRSPAFLQLGKIFEQAASRVHFFDNQLTPAQKYQYLLENKRELLQKFPLKYIASYLKITPETLSRVRKNFSKEGIS